MDLGTRETEPPPPPTVISTLDDRQCRELLRVLDEPRSVRELVEAADIPLSTSYRKIARLQDASLVDERTKISPSGHHKRIYVQDFERLIFELNEDRRLELDISRPLSEPESQLVDMWSEVRDAT